MIILLILTGAAAGISAGLFGSGGGLVAVPLLTFILLRHGVSIVYAMHIAVGTSLAIMILTSCASIYSHQKKHGVDWQVVKKMFAGLLVGAIVGGVSANAIPGHILYILFGIFVLISAFQVGFQILPKLKHPIHSYAGMSTFGLISSTISTILGVGGSTLTVPFLIMDREPMPVIAGTTSASTIPIAVIGTIIFIHAGLSKSGLPTGNIGFVNIPAFVIISIVSMWLASVSAKFSHRLSDKTQQKGFAIFLFLIAAAMVYHMLSFM